jgi:uncharacterized phage-like protein YoqJ
MNQSIIIGVTGHRDIIQTLELKMQIKNFFLELIRKYSSIKLLSPLADGADRFVADVFLDLQKEYEGLELIVPMPFSQERYMEDFNNQSKEKFLAYLSLVSKTFEVKSNDGCDYKNLGIYVTDNANLLQALWDGTFNHKSGGTGDIVQYARDNNREVIHFFSSRLLSS